jgi:hypothetical protein
MNVGDRAGWDGLYRRVSINSVNYQEHRIIWLWHGNEIPDGMQIDHINGDKHDNRIENLRCVTQEENLKNRRFTAGTGVYFDKASQKWVAQSRLTHGKQKFLGRFNTKEEAIQARKEYDLKVNNE